MRRGAALRLTAVTAFLAAACSDIGLEEVPYVPPVVFRGIINSDSVYLPGHQAYPNVCSLYADTVKLILRSADYRPSSTPTGVHMSITIGPLRRDSLWIRPNNLVYTGDVLFHLIDHTSGTSCSYYVIPRDTASVGYSFSMECDAFTRRAGAPVFFENMEVHAKTIGTYCGSPLFIERGVIEGRIE